MKARNNPFRTDRVLEVRYRLRGVSLTDLLNRLQRLSYRAAIVGPNGSGKTTLLEDLEPEICALGFRVKHLRLDDQKRNFPNAFIKMFLAELSAQDFIFFDGAEQMSALKWHAFKAKSRKAGGLLITSHAKGMLPTLTVCSTSPELLEEIVSDLLNGESLMSLPSTTKLFRKHDGNLRGALREMYDIYAAKPHINPSAVGD